MDGTLRFFVSGVLRRRSHCSLWVQRSEHELWYSAAGRVWASVLAFPSFGEEPTSRSAAMSMVGDGGASHEAGELRCVLVQAQTQCVHVFLRDFT